MENDFKTRYDIKSNPWCETSNWKIEICPGTHWIVSKDKKIPNKFNRFMQRIILGIKWIKIDD